MDRRRGTPSGPSLTVLPVSVAVGRGRLSVWDAVAFCVLLAVLALVALGGRGAFAELGAAEAGARSLDPRSLPWYAARTSLRMVIALGASFLFTLGYATLAAKNRRAGAFLIPLLDVLQSVPVLGFVSVATLFFLNLTPGRVLGAELVALFAIFTSQAWNMTFSLYASLLSVPKELEEVGRSFRLGASARFWRIELPYALPPLVWNAMVSMSGAWFFVVAAESIAVGNTTIDLPGVGTYIASALAARDLAAVGWAILTMACVILAYDVLLFRPLVAWSARFRYDTGYGGGEEEASVVYRALTRSRLVRGVVARLAASTPRRRPTAPPRPALPSDPARERRLDAVFGCVAGGAALTCLVLAWRYLGDAVSAAEAWRVVVLGSYTALRVFVLVGVASLVWVPIAVHVGLRPRLRALVQPAAQVLAAFPANLLFPLAVWAIVRYGLDPNVWLSPLMILGTQWYILFNVAAGAAGIPSELRDVSAGFHVRGWLWWRKVALPAVASTFLTGVVTASGGAWNASIVAELVHWGDETIEAAGLGAYIVKATTAGDGARIVLGIAVMSLYVVLINRAVWEPLRRHVARRFRLE